MLYRPALHGNPNALSLARRALKDKFPMPMVPLTTVLQNRRVFLSDPIYRVSQEEGTKFRESVSYVKIYRYNPKHLYPKLNGYGDNGQRSLKL